MSSADTSITDSALTVELDAPSGRWGRSPPRNPGPFQYGYRIHDQSGRIRQLVLVGNSEDSGGQVKRLSDVAGRIVDSFGSPSLNADGTSPAATSSLPAAQRRRLVVIRGCRGGLLCFQRDRPALHHDWLDIAWRGRRVWRHRGKRRSIREQMA